MNRNVDLDLETISFRVEGIAQALYAISASPVASDIGWALDILARETGEAAKAIEASLRPALAGS